MEYERIEDAVTEMYRIRRQIHTISVTLTELADELDNITDYVRDNLEEK